MSEGIITGIAATLRRAFEAQGNEEARFAFYCGKAGGMAAAVGVFGIKSLDLCDDISDAYETSDWDFLRHILSELEDRPTNEEGEPHGRTREKGIGWAVYGAVLDDALRSLSENNSLRYSLMIGFASGLMFQTPGPTYGTAGIVSEAFQHRAGDRPESKRSVEDRVAAALGPECPEITIRDAILMGHGAGCRELIEWARARVAAGERFSSPLGMMSPEGAASYYEESLRMMRWAQNFGLRSTRARDESVSVPNSMAINYALVIGAVNLDEDGEGE